MGTWKEQLQSFVDCSEDELTAVETAVNDSCCDEPLPERLIAMGWTLQLRERSCGAECCGYERWLVLAGHEIECS